MVDDFEDGDASIPETKGRVGAWYAYGDDSKDATMTPAGDFMPSDCGPGSSAYCAKFSGSGFADWGAGLSMDFDNPGNKKKTYDLGEFKGIAFWGRSDKSTVFRFVIPTSDVVPVADGGSCVDSGEADQECENGAGQSIVLTKEWAQYTVPFADAIPDETWGQQFSFDTAKAMGIQLQFSAGMDFEVEIDEIGLYRAADLEPGATGGAGGGTDDSTDDSTDTGAGTE